MKHSIRSNHPDNPKSSIRMPSPQILNEDQQTGSLKERAILVSVILPDTTADLRNPLGELAALAETAGVEVVDSMVQKRTALSANVALGKGKLHELAERVQPDAADVVIFDNELSPRQIRGLEKIVERRVIDRGELILDIFALHAQTREAQLQVELAQLEYTAPRIRGMWTHLERLAGAGGATAAGAVGGVGTRGPGERQIEIDRRLVRKRITHLKREIAEIDRRKQREVQSRCDEFTIALVGYTNSGKTTLLNKVTGSKQHAADQLFLTLDTKTVRWNLGDGHTTLLSDTVGFVRNLPHKLVASFRATLEEAIHADLLVHVVDVSQTTAYQQMKVVDHVLEELSCSSIPQLTLLNKIDIADDPAIVNMISANRPNTLTISAYTGQGLDLLQAEIMRRIEGTTVMATLSLPHVAGKLVGEIGRVAAVLDRRFCEAGVEMDVRINKDSLKVLVGRYPEINVISLDENVNDGALDPLDDFPFKA